MFKRSWILWNGRASRLSVALAAIIAIMSWASIASATITQGDFSVYGDLSSRWSGRWGEGGVNKNAVQPQPTSPPEAIPAFVTEGFAPTETGGSFDFNHWDLTQARQVANIRVDYHTVKNFSLLGRVDTLFLKDADFFGYYRPWYDAFPSLKPTGRAETARNWPSYTIEDKTQQFERNDLREYYGQLNFTDAFSMRIGKQQVIWSEADALSGTEVTNPSDLRFHWTHFESAEDLRKNVRMVKFNYLLPDFFDTANNEFEGFWIPGDWQGDALVVNSLDARSPYVVYAPLSAAPNYNLQGQIFRNPTVADDGPPGQTFTLGTIGGPPPTSIDPGQFFLLNPLVNKNDRPSNSIDNSEFGARYSTLIPIGSGLQVSAIYLWEARSAKTGFCLTCGRNPLVLFSFEHPTPPAPPNTLGVATAFLRTENVRQHWIGLTGTYYDKDLTDVVYRYDFLYAPKVAAAFRGNPPGRTPFTIQPFGQNFGVFPDSFARWTEETRWIIAADRPTYIPWISKQHTFIVAQNVTTWYPDLPAHAIPFFGDFAGKQRSFEDLSFISAVNWLINGQLTTTNVATWQWDNMSGFVESANEYRYSNDILFGANAIWYLGKSGRFSDPDLFSRDQRINELEFRFTYEI